MSEIPFYPDEHRVTLKTTENDSFNMGTIAIIVGLAPNAPASDIAEAVLQMKKKLDKFREALEAIAKPGSTGVTFIAKEALVDK